MIGHRFTVCLLLVTLLVGGSSSLGCSKQPCSCPGESEQGAPVEPRLVAFLSRARAAHHIADLREEDHPTQAVAALVEVVDGPAPRVAGTVPPEAREVIADTQARIADLQSRLMQFDEALKRISTALERVPEISYFRGHLFETRGLVEQRQAAELMRTGQRELAEGANARAVQAFETAMQIQAEVIRKVPIDASQP